MQSSIKPARTLLGKIGISSPPILDKAVELIRSIQRTGCISPMLLTPIAIELACEAFSAHLDRKLLLSCAGISNAADYKRQYMLCCSLLQCAPNKQYESGSLQMVVPEAVWQGAESIETTLVGIISNWSESRRRNFLLGSKPNSLWKCTACILASDEIKVGAAHYSIIPRI